MNKTSQPVLLSGGNPQIGKGSGDEKVEDYLAAVPGWKQDICRQLDTTIGTTVPNVTRSVKWNTPFYGLGKTSWFVSFHCLTKYIKVAFPDGALLSPMPPGTSKQAQVRYLDIYADKGLDAEQFAAWVEQASHLPGETF